MDSLIYAAVCHYTGKVFNPESFQSTREIDWMNISHARNQAVVKLTGSYIARYNVTFVAMAMNVSFMDKSETLEKAV